MYVVWQKIKQTRVALLQWSRNSTRYFHAMASQRKRNNHIKSLKNSEGYLVEDTVALHDMVRSYFNSLYHLDQPSHIPNVMEQIDRVVQPDMNAFLVQDFTPADVYTALMQMHPTKAPGPDGMTAQFFQKYWHIVGDDVTTACLNCIHFGKVLKTINYTHIALVPKVANPEFMTQFRPISLCNVLYKIVSKMLANRLKRVLPNIISESQSAFVTGRQITDNVSDCF
jgi:hypothetical protein